MRRRIEGIEMKVQRRWLDRVRDDIKEKGLSANGVHDHATCKRRGTCIRRTPLTRASYRERYTTTMAD